MITHRMNHGMLLRCAEQAASLKEG